MAKKVVYRPAKEKVRSGRSRPPDGSSTYSHQPPYLVSVKAGPRTPVAPREFVEQVRRRAERPLEPPSRRTLALVARALNEHDSLLRERWDREAAERDVKRANPLDRAAKNTLVGRWYVRTAEVGLVVPRARFIDGTPLRLHVSTPQHVASSLWRLLAGQAANDQSFGPVVG